jgi:hypothetical protein
LWRYLEQFWDLVLSVTSKEKLLKVTVAFGLIYLIWFEYLLLQLTHISVRFSFPSASKQLP